MQRKNLFIIIIVVLFFIFGTITINVYMICSTKNQIKQIEDINSVDDIDAIVVLGCKAYSNYPSEMLKYRLEKAIELYQKYSLKIILTGDHGQNDYDEVNVMKNYLIERDIPSSDIFLDHAGFSTYDSIYRLKHVFSVNKVFVVTQRYHLYRTLYLSNKLEVEAIGIEADDLNSKFIMFKNEIREILSRDKNFFKGIFKPTSKYVGEKISLDQDGSITEG